MRYTHAFTPITGLGVPATLCGPLHYLGSLCHSLLWHWPNPNREVTCINGANPEGGERLIVLQAATSGARRMPRQNSLCPRRQQSMLPGRGKWGEKCLPRCARRILRQNFLMCAAAVALRKWGQLVGDPSETLFVFMGATVLGRAHYSMCHIPRGHQAEKLDKKSADYISLDRFCV